MNADLHRENIECHEERRLTALLFSRVFPSPAEPTFAPFILNTFRALGEFAEVKVVSPRPWNPFETRALWRGGTWQTFEGLDVSYPLYPKLPRLLPGLHAPLLYSSLRRRIARIRHEFPFSAILSAWAYPDAVVAQRLASELGCVHITRVLGTDINVLPRNPRLRGHIAHALAEANAVVAVSSALKRSIISLGVPEEKVVVHHNAVDGSLFQIRSRDEARATLGISSGQPLVCFIGNMIRVKGPDVLMEALGELRRGEAQNIRAAFIGSGDLVNSLKTRAATLGLMDSLYWRERVPQSEVRDWITAADIICLPSRNEGCPNVVLEAHASGRPIVASEVGGVPELVSHENGILAPSENPDALAKAIESAFARPWSAERIRSGVKHLSWNHLGRTYADMLERAIRLQPEHNCVSMNNRPSRVGV